ncbi:MAG TPA: electron transfer flavoprotein subunit alpha [Bacteroidales bacterium]|nr:MAG: electron transfer flavoprotein subunit alpha [Bacteroidetes bacterium GWE2_42_24]OFY26537.1 MAG: electron transfer flavoprotein subunit alpha [Bacteroidetes bacterium GWF2_43_11]HBZ67413.1 electron transfer flavoprotein subunit alpha [Bacteroidales bacterium]
MNNVIVYCEITEEGHVAEVSQELLSKGRKLASDLGIKLEAIAIGNKLDNIEKDILPYGADVIHIADDKRLFPYTTLPHAAILLKLFEEIKPEIALFGATSIGRDLAPRVASAMRCGLTADCTSLEIGDHTEAKTNTTYKNLLYQIRPAFGGNIIATIINPDTRPQMATVREGVMKKEFWPAVAKPEVNKLDVAKYVNDEQFVVRIIERHIESQKINIKNAQVIVAGGYGVGSKENFDLLFDLADVLGAQVGASRAAVDAGYVEHERQIGQTGVTVRPKLYIACGISGAVQHRAGMDQASMIISVNTDPNAPINQIADYTILGQVHEVVPRMIKYYRQNSK